MALGDSYPVELLDDQGNRVATEVAAVQFTDGADQPSRSGGGSQAVLSATVVVSSAEILALVDTPVELVAAPAAGHALVPLQIISALSESDYLNENAQVQLAWGPEWDAANGLSSVDSMLVAGSGAQFGVDFPTAQTDSPSAFDGLPLVLGSGGDPFTDGTGVLKITVLYALVASS